MGSLPEVATTRTAFSADDLSSYEFVFVKYSSTTTAAKLMIELCESGESCGVLQQGVVAGRPMEFVPNNGQWTKLKASAAITLLDKVGPTTGGEGVTVASDTNAYYFIADSAATAADDYITGYTANATIAG